MRNSAEDGNLMVRPIAENDYLDVRVCDLNQDSDGSLEQKRYLNANLRKNKHFNEGKRDSEGHL